MIDAARTSRSLLPVRGLWCLAVVLFCGPAFSDTLDSISDSKVEHYPSGQIKRQYDEGEAGYEGAYLSWHANGTAAIKGHYRAGRRHGNWKEWDEDGLPIRDGQYDLGVFTGTVWKRPDALTEIEEKWIDGLLLRPESREGLLRSLNRARDPHGKRNHASEAQRAIARLQGYRALSGIPWRLRWDETCSKDAVAASSLCKALDGIPSEREAPENPSLDEAEFRAARSALKTCALDAPAHKDGPPISRFPTHRGRGLPLWYAVDRMVASVGDESLKNRLICLDPLVKRAAIATADHFVALRGTKGDAESSSAMVDAVYWPPRGLSLRTHFTRNARWSVFLNAARYGPLDPKTLQVSASVFKHAPKSARHLHLGERVNVDLLKAWTPESHSHLRVISFLPRLVDTRRGSACYIILSGLTTSDKKPTELRYFVIFD